MSSDAKLILKPSASIDRWEYRERADYDLDRMEQEFQEQLYSKRGREILQAQSKDAPSSEESGR